MGKVKKKTETSATKAPKKKSAAKAKTAIPWPTDIEYINLFNTCVVAKEHIKEVDNIIDKIMVPNRGRYENVANQASSPLAIFDAPQSNYPMSLGDLGQFGNYANPLSLSAMSSPYNTPSLLRNMPSTLAGPGGTTFPVAPVTPTWPGQQATGAAGNLFNGLNPLGGSPLEQSPLLGGLSYHLTPMGGARIPWYVVAVIHHMEGSSNFKTHLHNGDPLTGYTVNVPAGRPKVGHPPPFTWEESAVDSLKTKEHFDKITHWSLPVMLQRMESYNGAGYKNKKMTSPYLWAYSNHYTKGKYVKDGKFDAEAISKQLGAGVILKRMEERAIIYIPRW